MERLSGQGITQFASITVQGEWQANLFSLLIVPSAEASGQQDYVVPTAQPHQ
jgi:hypothetical protein